MEEKVPGCDDHCRIKILVKQLGRKDKILFNSVLTRLSRITTIDVENTGRYIRPVFVTQANSEADFAILQPHRKIFGLIAVISLNNIRDDADSLAVLGSARVNFDQLKNDINEDLVSSRCVSFGRSKNIEQLFPSSELHAHDSLEESASLEDQIRDFLRTIYYVLESRRIDINFEKPDTSVNCPALRQEERYITGLEDKTSKTYRKKCLGRLRKQCADYALLTGQFRGALEGYQNAIDPLKSAGDLLWLAAAYEGWAVAALAARFSGKIDEERSQIQRTVSMQPEEMKRSADEADRLNVVLGHQRHRSDETSVLQGSRSDLSNLSVSSSSTNSLSNKKTFKKALAMLSLERSIDPKEIDLKDIIERFKSALKNYERYSFIAFVEFECVIRVVNVYKMQRLYIDTEVFLRDRVGKYLADTFTLFSNQVKSQICMICAAIYKSMGFRRKNAFFSRLAVLFRLHVDDDEYRSEADYKIVYPVLYSSLRGYGVDDSVRGNRRLGHVSVQVKALHEVFMSAQRAGLTEAAVRHLCYILQTYFYHIDNTVKLQLVSELKRLVHTHKTKISLAQPIALEQCSLILPPLQMTKIPVLTEFKIQPLAPNLAPTISNPADAEGRIFIYSPFQDKTVVKDIVWVVNTACQVSAKVLNLLPMDLVVENMIVHTDGASFDPVPVQLNLSATEDNQPPAETTVALLGIPRTPGWMTLTGYSCRVFDVENVCSLNDLPETPPVKVRVLPHLPRLQVDVDLKRAPILEEMVGIAEATVFSGQTFFHTIKLRNVDQSIGIRTVRIRIDQPKVYGGPPLLEFVDLEEKNEEKQNNLVILDGLGPGEERQLNFKIFGIDPSASTSENNPLNEVFVKKGKPQVQLNNNSAHNDKQSSEESTKSSPVLIKQETIEEEDAKEEHKLIKEPKKTKSEGSVAELNKGHHDLIPYIGRLLTAEFIFEYVADIETESGEIFERQETLKLAITIVPAITVSHWQVLAGDSPTNRFVVVDVTNTTELDAELEFGTDGRMISVQPKEACRVPLLCPCSNLIHTSDFHRAAQRASHMMQMQEMEALRRRLETHFSQHLEIRWRIKALGLDGLVPVGPLLSSVGFLKQLVVPVISIVVRVNGNQYLSEDDLPVLVGQMQNLEIELVSSTKVPLNFHGYLQLLCIQDIQNAAEIIDRTDFLVVCGVRKQPFSLKITDLELDKAFKTRFSFLFRSEGVFKIRPQIEVGPGLEHFMEELIVPTVSFNVKSRK
ncbi:unnamed protein product [Bursaphelenchus xylophilus]|uniref:(pine wood nematode) hypothetical protein n=1 Tax=Bursaphelenchus xylophilus TaxID=6326 RepID=A0A1I7RK24_BURXY|nr:unnamed protein product [Bursaphelenchus xylophilus]CAG9131559.1 unnamed protein product [Bursaphelenchus xylophilus]